MRIHYTHMSESGEGRKENKWNKHDCAYADKSVIASAGAYYCPFHHYAIKPQYFARTTTKKQRKKIRNNIYNKLPHTTQPNEWILNEFAITEIIEQMNDRSRPIDCRTHTQIVCSMIWAMDKSMNDCVRWFVYISYAWVCVSVGVVCLFVCLCFCDFVLLHFFSTISKHRVQHIYIYIYMRSE